MSRTKHMIRLSGLASSTLLLAGCGLLPEQQSSCERAFHKVFDCREALVPMTTEQGERVSELIEMVCESVEENVPCDVDPRINCAIDKITCDDLFPNDQIGSFFTPFSAGLAAFEGCPDVTEECEAGFDQLVEDSSGLALELVMLLVDVPPQGAG